MSSLFDSTAPGFLLAIPLVCGPLFVWLAYQAKRVPSSRWDEPMNDRWRDAHQEDR